MIDYAMVSEIGEKKANEDAVKVFVNTPLSAYGFVLADGLGGYGNGDIASNFVVDYAGAAIENTDSIEGDFIDECFDMAQKMLMEEKELNGYTSIKTTMLLLLIDGNRAKWGHIGDSRIYHFREGKMLSRTIDHSVPQMLALSGQIKEREIRHHPDRSMLLRAMGDEWDVPAYEIDERSIKLRKGDNLLLCSDGFWEWIEEKTMLKILKQELTAFDALAAMTKEVVNNGEGKGMDNYSAILINVD